MVRISPEVNPMARPKIMGILTHLVYLFLWRRFTEVSWSVSYLFVEAEFVERHAPDLLESELMGEPVRSHVLEPA